MAMSFGLRFRRMADRSSSRRTMGRCWCALLQSSVTRIMSELRAAAMTSRPRPLLRWAPAMMPGMSSNWMSAPPRALVEVAPGDDAGQVGHLDGGAAVVHHAGDDRQGDPRGADIQVLDMPG